MRKNKIKDAVIIHGPGRSGTTLLSNILSLHQEFYWISGYVSSHPQLPFLSFLNNLQGIDCFEKMSRSKRGFPRPSEAYGFWNYYFENFNSENEIPKSKNVDKTLSAISMIRQFSKGNRFITKLTGMSRIEHIDALFDNPHIIWIDRKPEAVVMSFFKQKWKYKDRLYEYQNMSNNMLIEEYCELYSKFFIDKKRLNKFSFHQVYYEDLVSNPLHFFEKIITELNMNMDNKFKDKILSWDIRQSTNESYKKSLSRKEIILLETNLVKYSRQLGYE